MAEPEKLGEIIAQGGIGTPRRKKQRLDLLQANWVYLVDGPCAEHSKPTRLSRGSLTVAADGASWAAEVSLASGELMKGIDRLLGVGAVRRVKVQARPVFESGGMAARESAAGVVEAAAGEIELGGRLEEELGMLKDAGVREALTRMVKASRASKQYEHDD